MRIPKSEPKKPKEVDENNNFLWELIPDITNDIKEMTELKEIVERNSKIDASHSEFF
jgi:hypothetical protein